MKIGEIYKFDYVNGHTRDLNNRLCVYLGEEFIHRRDGVTVENHKILMLGESTPRIIDKGLVRWLKEVIR